MFEYIDYTYFSLLKAYLIESQGANVVESMFLDTWSKLIGLNREKIDQWKDIQNFTNSQESLFEEVLESEKKVFLIDVGDLSIDEKVVSSLKNTDFEDAVYLYSSSKEKLGIAEKNLWKKAKLKYTELKKTETSIAQAIFEKKISEMSHSDIVKYKKSVLDLAKDYEEIIDLVDLLDLSDDPERVLAGFESEAQTPLFWLGLNVDNPLPDVQKWLKNVPETDIQLALSLLFTKLSKSNSQKASDLKQKLIQTDHKMKTISKVPISLWWKYFLWQIANS